MNWVIIFHVQGALSIQIHVFLFEFLGWNRKGKGEKKQSRQYIKESGKKSWKTGRTRQDGIISRNHLFYREIITFQD